MTIGVPGFGTDGQMDRWTGGQKIVIAGGERSVYRDSGWILSQIILIAGGRRSKFLFLREDDDLCTRIWDRRTDGQNDRWTENCYCGRRLIGVPRLGLDFVTNNFNCGSTTIKIPFIAGG
jgi:hypothetical protein